MLFTRLVDFGCAFFPDRSFDALKMDQNVGGYDNSACARNDGGVHARVAAATIEMQRLDVAGKCCGGSNRNGSNSSDADVAPNVCQPKCPAVRQSPWDPTKTRFAVCLIVAVVLWIIGGVIALKF